MTYEKSNWCDPLKTNHIQELVEVDNIESVILIKEVCDKFIYTDKTEHFAIEQFLLKCLAESEIKSTSIYDLDVVDYNYTMY